jgi:hypothetical protein
MYFRQSMKGSFANHILPRPRVYSTKTMSLHYVYHPEKIATKQSLKGKILQVNTSEGNFFLNADKYLGIYVGI